MKKKPVIGIIGGTGRFGGWFRNFFEGRELKVLVASRKTKLTPIELAKKADIVIVSVTIPATVKVIKKIRDHIRKDALLCDFTSIKTLAMKEMMKAKSGCGVTGIHPLFGPLVPSLNKQIIVFCSGRDNHWTKYLEKLFRDNGGAVIYTDPASHDRQMAVIQALTHFVNVTLARAIQKQKFKLLNVFTSPVFRLQSILSGRVLGGNPELYADIEMENPFFKEVVAVYQKEVEKFALHIKSKNKEKFAKDFREAAAFMDNFIPVAQAKAVEVISLMDRQPIEIKKNPGIIRLENAKGGVAYLGPEGTFSHQAVQNIFPGRINQISCSTITRVFDAVINEEVIFGAVPAENSTEGLIQETMDNLVKYPLRIVGSYNLPIHLYLLARITDGNKIKIIKSHAQPIAQARIWLSKNFPNVKFEIEPSSVKAILSTKDPSVAFIGSRAAAKKYDLKILAENIEDKKNNITQFYVISKKESPDLTKFLGAKKILLLLAVYDRPGVLRDILTEFADRHLNLTKLHSKISEAEGWDYYFFVEVDEPPASERLQEALKKIKQFCSIVRVLGVT